jgi:hypothetical protein
VASIPEPPVAGRTLADLRQSGLSAAAAVVVFDGILAALERAHAGAPAHPHIDAQTVLVTPDGRVELAGPDAPEPLGGAQDVRDAARLVSPVVATGGRRFQRVLHLLEAIVEGRAATSPAEVRAQLAAAAGSLEPSWNNPRRLAAEAALPAGAGPASGRRGGRRLLWGLVPLVLLAGAVAALLLLRGGGTAILNHGPLAIGSDAVLHVRPTSGGCSTTFTFEATGSVSGVGRITFRWEQSDGNQSDVATVAITAEDGSFDFTQAWRLEGTQAFTGTETFHVLTPADRTFPASFQYHCP